LQRGSRPLVIGHRGGAADAAPNSLEGLVAAVAAAVDLVEVDVGEALLLGHPGEERCEPPLHLEAALAYLAPHTIGVHVDLKAPRIEAAVAAAIRASGLEERAVVSSSSGLSLRRLAGVAPSLARAISYPRDRVGVAGIPWPAAVKAGSAAALRAVMPLRARALLARSRAGSLSLHHALVSPAVVSATHARGAALLAWTVNDPARVERLTLLGVDAIVSDDPRMVFEVLGTLSRS